MDLHKSKEKKKNLKNNHALPTHRTDPAPRKVIPDVVQGG